MTTIDAEIFRKAVCFTVTFRKFSNRRRGRVENVKSEETTELGAKADKSLDPKRFKITKKLIDSPQLDAISEYQRKLYEWICNRSNPSHFKEGIYLVKNDLVPAFESKLRAALEELHNTYVPALLEQYEAQIEQARIDLGSQFNASDYPRPQDLPARFGIEWNWIAFGVPENLPEELRKAEADKIAAQFREAEVEIMTALRSGFCEILSHVTDRLTVPAGEKPKTFRNTLFADLTTFIETFSARNLCDDKELGKMIEQAHKILAEVQGESAEAKADFIREASIMREKAGAQFASMRKAVDEMIANTPTRRFEFDEDDHRAEVQTDA